MKSNKEDFGIILSQFFNSETVNIFSDASMTTPKKDNQTGCFGVVAVIGNDIVDQRYRIVSNTTSNNSEIKGIRTAIDMAGQFAGKISFINIFSDSQVSIFGLREYIFHWKKKGEYLYNSVGKKVSNQNIFIESRDMLNYLENSSSIISLYHQSGHINDKYKDLLEASDCFKKFNNINGKIDLNFIRYISTWNNYVDKTSRSLLRRNIKNNNTFEDPLLFFPI